MATPNAAYGGQTGYGGQQNIDVPQDTPINVQKAEETSSPKDDSPVKEQPTKSHACKKKLIICSLVLGVIFGLWGWISAIQAYALMSTYIGEYGDLAHSWEAEPIIDVLLVDGQCPTSYSPIATYAWPGITGACNCVKNASMSDSFNGECTNEQIEYKCFSAPGLNGFDINSILTDPDTRVCARRGKTKAVDRKSLSDCPASEKCGGHNGTFAFCYPSGDAFPCPITDLFFKDVNSESEANTTAATLNATDYSYSNVSKVAVFYTRGGVLRLDKSTRDTDATPPVISVELAGFPIIDLLAKSGLPCYHNEGRGYSGRDQTPESFKTATSSVIGDPKYFTRGIELSQKDTGCKAKTELPDYNNPHHWDIRYVVSYGRNEVDILTAFKAPNGQNYSKTVPPVNNPNKIIPADFLFSGNYIQYVVYRTEAPWYDEAAYEKGCPIKRSQVVNAVGETTKLEKAQTALLVATSLSFLIVTCCGSFYQGKYILKDDDGKLEKGEEGHRTQQRFKYCKWALKIVGYIAMGVSIAVAFGVVGFFISLVEKYGDRYCADPLSQKNIDELSKIIKEMSHKDFMTGMAQIGDFAADLMSSAADHIVKLLV
eukprot:g17977.t1